MRCVSKANMWPQTLQMNRDECRGILRRLELESYSQVISVLRAQGGLNDAKAKLLEELRSIFHISQERHRAEARRVANDEQLATIAEAISGPNTWQEWSREGRRPYPLLPRVAPQTALALLANNLVEELESENAELPQPSETGEAAREDQLELLTQRSSNVDRRNYVITTDPFKIPEIPTTSRRNLKRNNDQLGGGGGAGKKRTLNDNSSQKNSTPAPYTRRHHVTANSSSASTSSGSNPKKSNAAQINKNLQQQRFFHQQQQLQKQKIAKKSAANNNSTTATGGKRQATPAKSGRRTQKFLEQQKQQLLIKQQQQQQQLLIQQQLQEQQQHQHVDVMDTQMEEEMLSPLQLSRSALEMHQFNPYSPQPHPPQQIFMDSNDSLDSPTTSMAAGTSKRVITKNLTKRQIKQQKPQKQQNQQLGNAAIETPNLFTLGKLDKSVISTTPVQKYIVEDRQPTNATGNPTHIIQVSSARSGSPQIMTLPQFSATATKLRAINTTILAPGTKLTTVAGKKLTSVSPVPSPTLPPSSHSPINASALHELANVATSQTQLFNVIDTAAHSNSTNNQQQQQQHGENVPQSQTKVLTTKMVPVVISSAHSNSTSTTTSNIVVSGLASTSTSTATVGGIIKSFPSTVVMTPTTTSASNSIISTLNVAANVYRKPTNVIKTTAAGGGLTTKSTGPHIISNVKLTPVTVSSGGSGALTTTSSTFKALVPSTTGLVRTNVKICQSSNGKVFIQSAGLVDASKVKLNTGSLQHKLLTTAVGQPNSTATVPGPGGQRIAIQKVQIIPAPLNATTKSGTGPGTGTGNNNTNKNTKTSLTTTTGTNSSAVKGNVILMPVSVGSNLNVRPVTLSKTSNNLLLKTSTTAHSLLSPTIAEIQQTSGKGGNLLVLSNTAPLKGKKSPLTTRKYDNIQLLNEDAPLDILNMPIVMDPGVGIDDSTATGSATANSVTVLGGNIMETSGGILTTSNTTTTTPIIAARTAKQTLMGGATDWELELDHAITVGANNNNNNNNTNNNNNNNNNNNKNVAQKMKIFRTGKQKRTIATSTTSTSTPAMSGLKKQKYATIESYRTTTNDRPSHLPTTIINTNASNIVVDDSFDDVIVEERDEDDNDNYQKDYTYNNNNENVKLLDIQMFPHQQQPLTGVMADDNTNTTTTITTTTVSNKKKKRTHAMSNAGQCQSPEFEVDAGFDETIVTEIDENTAIEYIEEENCNQIPLTTPSSSAMSSSLAADNMEDEYTHITKAATAQYIEQINNRTNNRYTIINNGCFESFDLDGNTAQTTSSSVQQQQQQQQQESSIICTDVYIEP